ncbi:metallophosphoesterase [Knoellia sp. S7-12]|uniref:metallophosphoesterase family protein n=1 Tax=Knoellia sp. S7-12 TaxID=3126698 RepID=UPI00338FE37F
MEADIPEGCEGVLHISDLHFGTDHGYSRRPQDSTYFRRNLLEKVTESLPCRPACVVVSGDLTTKGQGDGLRSARLFLEELAERLGLPKHCIVIAPGNHDILIDDPELTRDFSNELPFRELLALFYGEKVDIERVHDLRDPHGRHYIIGVLNSSRPRHRTNMDYGYVGRDRSAPVFRSMSALAQRPRQAAWVAVTLHHHVLPGQHVEIPEEERPVSLCLDAGELLTLAQESGVSTILHGHQHLPFAASVTRLAEYTSAGVVRPKRSAIHVLASGSSGVEAGRIPGEIGLNTFSIYRPFNAKGRVKVACYAYRDVRDVERVWELTLRN